MGQKSHPVGLRLGYVKPWSSRWYADRDYAKILHEDIRVRKTVKGDRKSTRLNSSHGSISYAVFCLKKKKKHTGDEQMPHTSDTFRNGKHTWDPFGENL